MTALSSIPDPGIPRQQVAANYASVAEQADELKLQIAQARNNIKLARRSIEENEDFIVEASERRQKLLKKKRIFARAKVELEELDEE